MNPFFGTSRSRDYDGHFAKELLEFLVSIPEARRGFPQLQEELKSAANMVDIAERETFAAQFYRKVEEFLITHYAVKYNQAALRELVRRKYHAERIGEGAALLFMPQDLRIAALHRLFTNEIAARLRSAVGDETFKSVFSQRFGDQQLAAFFIKAGALSWPELTDLLARVSEGDRARHSQELFTRLASFLANMLRERMQDARTQLVIEDLYRAMKKRYLFLEDFPAVLAIIADEKIMKDERVGLLSKGELTEHARIQTRKIEETLAQLQHEKEQLERALKALEVSQEKLKALDFAKSQFIDVVSHQFRTPLSTIRWSAEAMADTALDKLNAQEKEFLATMRHKTIFIINILNDIFDVLAVEGGTMSLHKKPAALWEVVADGVKMMENESALRKVKVVFARGMGPIHQVLLDHDSMRRVLEILIRNAVQYSEENSEVHVTMGEEVYGGQTYEWAQVSDSGIGVSEEDLPKIFGKFFRAQNAIRKVPDGAGLGLYLVRNIVEAHGGRVVVSSELGKGTKVRFYIPVEARAQPQAA